MAETLPTTWRQSKLGAISAIRYGLGVPPALCENGIPMIRATNIKRGRIVSTGLLKLCPDTIPSGRNATLTSGEIIVVRSGAYTGDSALVTSEWAGAVVGYDLVVTPAADIDSRFLALWLLGESAHGYFRGQRDRSAQPHLNRQQLADAELVLPPLDEQRKIAAVLSAVQRAIERQERLIALTAELKKALMHKFFTEGTRGETKTQPTRFGVAPASWQIRALGDCAFVQTGVAKGRKIESGEAIELPYLRVANVQDGRLDLREMKTITIREREISRYLLRAGDVVLTEGGDLDKLGRGFIWREEISLCVHQNHVFAVRPDRSTLSSEFLAYQIQSPYGKKYFLSVAHKTTNLACINTSKLKALPVLLPSPDEQDDIVKTLQAVDARHDVAQRSIKCLRTLFANLLHQLMTAQIRVHDLDLSAVDELEETAQPVGAA